MENNKRSLLERIGSLAMAVVMVLSLLPVQAMADDSAGVPVGDVTTVADPDTVSRPVDVYGDDTENAGKVTVGKSVSDSAVTLGYGNTSQTFMPGEDNFIVTISQTAQVMGLASESNVPLDVVFVLDTSGSMNRNGVNRAASMVNAANDAIKTLMEANEHNRIAVVAFSANNQGGGTSKGAAANVLSSLAHYTGSGATQHLTWVDEDGNGPNSSRYDADDYPYIAGRDMITVEAENWWEDDYVSLAYRHGYYGGTNIQAGIITGAKLLTADTNTTTVTTEDGVVTRMPFIVILSDGQPTYSYSDSTWYNPTSTSQRGDGNNAYAGNGFIPAVTAAYYKGLITEKYYGTTASEDNRCSIYTIGVQLNEELAEITLNPKDNFAQGANNYYRTFSSYWNSFNNVPRDGFTVTVNGNNSNNNTFRFTQASVNATINLVNGKNRDGKVMYDGGLAYNDDYFAATQTEDIAKAFQDVVTSIQKKAISSPTKVDSVYGDDFSGYVTFTDPIGEYMEVKNIYGLLADGKWYRGQSFAYHLQNWSSAPQEFKDLLIKTLKTRCQITDSDFDVESALAQVQASPNQAYYNNSTDYDNSIVWWGNDMDSTAEIDEQVQFLAIADNDTIEYIEDNQATIQQLGADYVCRSYFFYGTAGDTSAEPDDEYLYFVVRVQRSLKAPYQQTVVISAPASLLSVEQVLITESTDSQGQTVYTATVTEAEPARVVYEVGLQEGINAFNVAEMMAKDPAYLNETAEFDGQTVYTNYNEAEGTYTFYTNDWNRGADEDSHERAMTKATFDAAADNGFYTYQEDTLIYVKNGNDYVPYAGPNKPVGADYYYAREVYDWSGAQRNEDGSYDAVKKTVYIRVYLPDSDAIFQADGSWYISEGVYKASSLTGGEDVDKDENKTGTSSAVVHPDRTADEDDSHYTVYLGNNGKLTLKALVTKKVSINLAEGATITDDDGKVVMVGDELTYTIDVVNYDDEKVTADVTDIVPRGTAYVEGSATHGGVYADGKITWDDVPVDAGQTVQVSFKVVVTDAALSGDLDVVSINNAASVTLSNGFSYTTNTTENPPEGKKVVDSEGNLITGTVEVQDVLVYRIRWHNDSGKVATVTVTDIIPAGTTYVQNSASHDGVYNAEKKNITWTMKDVQPGTSGVVSFRVNVNASAVEHISNDASIKIGENDPRQTNDTKVVVSTGDLVLSKTVNANGFDAAKTQTFTLNITEIGGGLSGTYVMVTNGNEGTVTFVNGRTTITIHDGDTIEIKGLPAGAIFSVTEAVKNGFTPTYTVGTSTSGSEGRVTIPANADVSVAVTNTYDPDAVTFRLEGTKVLDTAVFVDDLVFGFTAYGCDDAGGNLDAAKLLTGEVTVSSSAKEVAFAFSPVTFETVGTYYYLVSEIDGGLTGVNYATNQYLLAVTVTDDGSGQLKASATLLERADESGEFKDADEVEFTNGYVPKETQLTLEAAKELIGRTLKAGEFSFVVKDAADNVVTTGTNDANGKITFRPITYKTAGEYTYYISEVNGGLQGVEYSTAQIAITVKVEDVNGQLTASASYPSGGVKFTNTYTPAGITVTLEANKTLTNNSGDEDRVLGDQEFNFAVTDEAGRVVTAGTNDANGKIVFNPIGYTINDAGKTFTYQIEEVIPDVSGDPYMDYDESSFTVTVAVTYDAQTGTLSANVTYPEGGVKFNNIQHPDAIEVIPTGKKATIADNNNVPADATFSFTVIDVSSGKEVGAGVANANGQFLFSKLTYSEAGTYQYWIKETHAGMEAHGITYDDAVFLMKVVVTKTNGKLEAAVTYYSLAAGGDASDPADYTVVTELPAFENHYDAKGQIAITADKVLKNLKLNAGDFAFRLVRQDNGHEITGIVDANGNIQFATLYFDLSEFAEGQTAKTIHYHMSEVVPANGKLPGVTYDTSVRDVYITITHDGTGVITAMVTDSEGNPLTGDDGAALDPKDSNVTFTNTYAPEEGTSATIEAEKALTGRDLADGEFTFELYHVDGEGKERLVATATNDADGKILFTRTYAPTVLNGADSITLQYVIREVDNRLGGVTYDGTVFRVKVTITDNKDGTISSAVTYEGLEEGQTVPEFSNAYDAKDTIYTPVASKILENRVMEDNEFSFVVRDTTAQQNVVSTGTSKADGTVAFSAIGYSAAGTYRYTIHEVKGNLSGVTYTEKVYYLTVTVVDNGDGTMTATGEYFTDAACTQKVDKAVFTNVYTPDSVSIQLQANKVLTGRDMEDSEFSFVAEMLDGTVMATGSNVAAGDGQSAAIIFSAIGYELADLQGRPFADLIYRVRETGVTQGGVTGDTTAYYACVRLSLNKETGKLETEVSYYADENLTQSISGIQFKNTYAPKSAELAIAADKTLINKKLEAGEFTFTLKDTAGKTLQTKDNAADGTIAFEALKFDLPGTYVYTVSESVTDQAEAGRYTLDDPFTVVVTVVDDLKGNLRATATYHVMDASGNYDAAVNLGGVEFINWYTAPPVTKDLSLEIGATKKVETPEGITYSPAGFTFHVRDIKNNLISTGTSDAQGKISFTEFTFNQAGEYHYWVYEVDTDKGGITEDTRVWEIHILVRYDEQTGLLYINEADVQTYPMGRSAAEDGAPVFVNIYQPASVKLNLTATKILEGRGLKDREFLFYLMEGDRIAAQAYNSADGTVSFEMTYTQIGTHTYTIVEHQGSLGGVTYNDTVYAALTVEVMDNGEGQLVAYVGGQALSNGATVATGVSITNQYAAKPASATVLAHKVLTGSKALNGDDFTFTLRNKDDETESYTAKNNLDGHIEFLLSFEKVGVYTYTLCEVKGSDPSITYDETEYMVTVTVVDDGRGQLQATVAYNTADGHAPIFENAYKAAPVTAEIKAHKTLTGEKLLAEGQYFFELEGEGVKITDVTNDANGNVVFHVTLDAVGKYTYVIRETKGTELGTTYDETEYTVTVTITDNLNGNLVADVAYEGVEDGKIPGFTNSYKGAETSIKVTAGKKLTGKNMIGEEFSFRLVNKLDNNEVYTAKNDANGNVAFDLTFRNSGVYVYTLSEIAGTDTKMTYDVNTYTVTITVTDDLKGYLTAEVEYSTTDGAAPVFINAYQPDAVGVVLNGTKKLTGRDLEAGEFNFQVRDGQGNLVATAKNGADGKIVFGEIKLPTAGKYTFTVTEVKGSNISITYDETAFTVSVNVVNDNGTLKAEVTYPESGIVFENVYEKYDHENPDTGDHSGMALYLTMMTVSMLGFAVMLLVMKKRAYR